MVVINVSNLPRIQDRGRLPDQALLVRDLILAKITGGASEVMGIQ